MKKFLFVVSFVVLSQVSLADDTNSGNHTSATNTATNAQTSTSNPVAVDRTAKIFEYVNACLAGRPIPSATSTPAVSK